MTIDETVSDEVTRKAFKLVDWQWAAVLWLRQQGLRRRRYFLLDSFERETAVKN